jgi:cation:H+ antiporter
MAIIYLILGLVLILLGANGLTDGAAALAKRHHIPPLVIGLTIVAFGTSAPELAVSMSAAVEGNADIALGNVIGSNIFNIFMIVGITSIIAPIRIGKSTLSREIPFCLLSALVILLMANDVLFDHAEQNMITRTDGMVLLAFFAIFLAYTFAIAKNGDIEASEEIPTMGSGKSTLYIILGLGALIIGGRWFVDGASDIARMLGISESIIALTLVAGGTSLPELATSIVAARKNNPDIAIGNVVGSNLFNLFFVLGASASIQPVAVSGINNMDFITHIVACILLLIFGVFFHKRMINRTEGVILTFCYLVYTGYLISQV